MSLKDDLDMKVRQAKKDFPPEIFNTIVGETRRLEQSGIAGKGLKAGDKAPSFSLPNIKGDLISSSDLLAKGPLVVSFYRGGW